MERKEEKELLKKSGFYSVVILFIISIFWFLFSTQTSFGYSGTGATEDLKSGSRLNGDLLAQPLNGSITIYFGTQSTQGSGTIGYIGTNTAGLPFLRYSFLNGSSSINFSGFGAVYIGGTVIPSAGSLSTKLDSNGGAGTNNTFYNPTVISPQFAGSTTIGSGSTITAGGIPFDGTKVRFLADTTQNIEANIGAKLTKVGTSTTYLASVTANGKTGTTSVSLASGSANFSVTSTLNPNGALDVVLDTTGSSTAKPDVWEGGTVTVSNAAHVNFDNTNFDTAVDGSGVSVTLSSTRTGTTSVSSGYVPISIANNLNNWVKPNLSFISKTDTQLISSNHTWVAISGLTGNLILGSTTSKVKICLTVSGVSSPNSWVRLLRDGTAIAVGDTSGSKVPCTLGDFFAADGNTVITKSTIWLDSPGSTTASYTVEARTAGAATFYVNRSQTDSDTNQFPRCQSSLFIEEIYQ